MKIKLTLHRQQGSVDVVATVDSRATVGQLAEYLARTDPAFKNAELPAAVSLTLTLLGGPRPEPLDPRQPVAECPIRSGSSVTINQAASAQVQSATPQAATLRVTAGPDKGREFQLPFGNSVIGRERGVDVRLSDPLVSRQHARVNITNVVEVIDLGSANGVLIDSVAVPRATLRSSDVVQIGDTQLSVAALHTLDPAAASGGTTAFMRSPRVDPVYEGRVFPAPELPEKARTQRIPIIPMLAPLLIGPILYLVLHSVTSLAFMALSPIMLVGNAFESRLAANRAYKRDLEEFRGEVAALVEDVRLELAKEVRGRENEYPSAARCLVAADAADPVLWCRRPGVRGFGALRLGVSRLPSRSSIELPPLKKATRAVYRELQQATDELALVDPVPVVVHLDETCLGVAGPRTLALPIARSVITQLVALHSPAEVVLAAAASTQSAMAWDWLKWLPHTSSPASPLETRHLASTAAAGNALISEIEAELDRRRVSDLRTQDPDAVVALLVESDAPVDNSRLVAIAEHGPKLGIWVIWIADEVAHLPAACGTFIDAARDGMTGSVGFVHTGNTVAPTRLDIVDEEQTAALGRRLAPVTDIGARTSDASDLPRSVSLLSIMGTALAGSTDAVIERWRENQSIISGPAAPSEPPRHAGTLRAVVGSSAGEVHALDLRADGPHALVGGTTGSGKSELLQAWILAMAAAHSPQRLTFLLVDYKGGSAFRDCVRLPHTVGLVTDLSPHLVRRALTSLSAELRYREHLLAKHAAKDLVTLERMGVVEAPPSLVIVVDEFAALVAEVPEFVDGVVNVAQRGRSLGLHLILATQRPAGVIKDNLRANTNLRVALRMADEGDSSDVLGSPEAAFFDQAVPGRAMSKTGPGRLVPFQTAYAGGWTPQTPPPPDTSVDELTFGASGTWTLPELAEAQSIDPGPTDIYRLVDTIAHASAIAEIEEPRKPWLPEMPSVIELTDPVAVPTRRTDTELIFGIQDDPDNQAQPTVAFHPDKDGNLAVFGTSGSGKSTLLRSLAVASAVTLRGGPCTVYGIDFGARGLAMLDDLPHVGSIINGGDHERIVRLLTLLRSIIDDRAQRYSAANAATISEYRRLANAPEENRILVLLDGVTAFRQAYETTERLRWFDLFTSIAADGRPVGVHVVLSSDQRSGLTTALASAVQSRVILRMATADDYSVLGIPADVIGANSPPGRGVLRGAEVQVAVLGGTTDVLQQAVAMKRFADSMRRNGVADAPEIRSLPTEISLNTLPTKKDGLPVLGIGSATLEPWAFQPHGTFVLTGPPGSGRTNALRALAVSMRRWNPSSRLILFAGERSPLAGSSLWTRRALGIGAATEMANDLASRWSERPGPDPVGLFIEGLADYASSPADAALQALIKLCTAEGHFIVAEGETSAFVSAMGLVGLVKAGRAGLALNPDPNDGQSVFRTNFPRLNAVDLVVGRGIAARGGRTEVVQVALSDDF